MKRSLTGILCPGAVVAALGVCGCGGGSAEEGVPKDLTPGVPFNTIKAEMGAPGSNKPKPQPKEDFPPPKPLDENK
jgi:hypothetical protein